MRSVLLILPLFIFSSIASQNSLRLYSQDGVPFKLFLNDSLINALPQANVLAQNVKQDTVKVKIVTQDNLSHEQNIYLLDKGKKTADTEFNYQVVIKNKGIKLVFAGMLPPIKIPEPLVPAKPVEDTTSKYLNKMLGHYAELNDGRISYFNNTNTDSACIQPMPSAYIGYYKMLMQRAKSEDDKFRIAENTILNNCMNTSQLNTILGYFPYEVEKLKLVKLCYFHLTDKKSFKNLDSSFKLEASKQSVPSRNQQAKQKLRTRE